MDTSARIREFRRRLHAKKIDAAYITSPLARRYISGFTGTTGMVLVTNKKVILFTDFRYTERAEEETSKGVTVENYHGHLARVKEILRENGSKNLGFENHEMNVAFHGLVAKKLRGIRLVPLDSIIEDIRGVKDREEVKILKKAIGATDLITMMTHRWLKTVKHSKKWPSEIEVVHKLREFVHAKKLGMLSPDVIVAFGKNTSRPHHEPTSQRLKMADPIIIDLGVIVNGYISDLARTMFVGPPRASLVAMYNTALKAQSAAWQYIANGGRGCEKADATARTIIETKYPNAFGHALGHGVGLEVHEQPALSPRSPHTLKTGMVFMLEPGIYIPQKEGVRIEDLVLLEKNGPKYLSHSPKTLKSMII